MLMTVNYTLIKIDRQRKAQFALDVMHKLFNSLPSG